MNIEQFTQLLKICLQQPAEEQMNQYFMFTQQCKQQYVEYMFQLLTLNIIDHDKLIVILRKHFFKHQLESGFETIATQQQQEMLTFLLNKIIQVNIIQRAKFYIDTTMELCFILLKNGQQIDIVYQFILQAIKENQQSQKIAAVFIQAVAHRNVKEIRLFGLQFVLQQLQNFIQIQNTQKDAIIIIKDLLESFMYIENNNDLEDDQQYQLFLQILQLITINQESASFVDFSVIQLSNLLDSSPKFINCFVDEILQLIKLAIQKHELLYQQELQQNQKAYYFNDRYTHILDIIGSIGDPSDEVEMNQQQKETFFSIVQQMYIDRITLFNNIEYQQQLLIQEDIYESFEMQNNLNSIILNLSHILGADHDLTKIMVNKFEQQFEHEQIQELIFSLCIFCDAYVQCCQQEYSINIKILTIIGKVAQQKSISCNDTVVMCQILQLLKSMVINQLQQQTQLSGQCIQQPTQEKINVICSIISVSLNIIILVIEGQQSQECNIVIQCILELFYKILSLNKQYDIFKQLDQQVDIQSQQLEQIINFIINLQDNSQSTHNLSLKQQLLRILELICNISENGTQYFLNKLVSPEKVNQLLTLQLPTFYQISTIILQQQNVKFNNQQSSYFNTLLIFVFKSFNNYLVKQQTIDQNMYDALQQFIITIFQLYNHPNSEFIQKLQQCILQSCFCCMDFTIFQQYRGQSTNLLLTILQQNSIENTSLLDILLLKYQSILSQEIFIENKVKNLLANSDFSYNSNLIAQLKNIYHTLYYMFKNMKTPEQLNLQLIEKIVDAIISKQQMHQYAFIQQAGLFSCYFYIFRKQPTVLLQKLNQVLDIFNFSLESQRMNNEITVICNCIGNIVQLIGYVGQYNDIQVDNEQYIKLSMIILTTFYRLYQSYTNYFQGVVMSYNDYNEDQDESLCNQTLYFMEFKRTYIVEFERFQIQCIQYFVDILNQFRLEIDKLNYLQYIVGQQCIEGLSNDNATHQYINLKKNIILSNICKEQNVFQLAFENLIDYLQNAAQIDIYREIIFSDQIYYFIINICGLNIYSKSYDLRVILNILIQTVTYISSLNLQQQLITKYKMKINNLQILCVSQLVHFSQNQDHINQYIQNYITLLQNIDINEDYVKYISDLYNYYSLNQNSQELDKINNYVQIMQLYKCILETALNQLQFVDQNLKQKIQQIIKQ